MTNTTATISRDSVTVTNHDNGVSFTLTGVYAETAARIVRAEWAARDSK